MREITPLLIQMQTWNYTNTLNFSLVADSVKMLNYRTNNRFYTLKLLANTYLLYAVSYKADLQINWLDKLLIVNW